MKKLQKVSKHFGYFFTCLKRTNSTKHFSISSMKPGLSFKNNDGILYERLLRQIEKEQMKEKPFGKSDQLEETKKAVGGMDEIQTKRTIYFDFEGFDEDELEGFRAPSGQNHQEQLQIEPVTQEIGSNEPIGFKKTIENQMESVQTLSSSEAIPDESEEVHFPYLQEKFELKNNTGNMLTIQELKEGIQNGKISLSSHLLKDFCLFWIESEVRLSYEDVSFILELAYSPQVYFPLSQEIIERISSRVQEALSPDGKSQRTIQDFFHLFSILDGLAEKASLKVEMTPSFFQRAQTLLMEKQASSPLANPGELLGCLVFIKKYSEIEEGTIESLQKGLNASFVSLHLGNLTQILYLSEGTSLISPETQSLLFEKAKELVKTHWRTIDPYEVLLLIWAIGESSALSSKETRKTMRTLAEAFKKNFLKQDYGAANPRDFCLGLFVCGHFNLLNIEFWDSASNKFEEMLGFLPKELLWLGMTGILSKLKKGAKEKPPRLEAIVENFREGEIIQNQSLNDMITSLELLYKFNNLSFSVTEKCLEKILESRVPEIRVLPLKKCIQLIRMVTRFPMKKDDILIIGKEILFRLHNLPGQAVELNEWLYLLEFLKTDLKLLSNKRLIIDLKKFHPVSISWEKLNDAQLETVLWSCIPKLADVDDVLEKGMQEFFSRYKKMNLGLFAFCMHNLKMVGIRKFLFWESTESHILKNVKHFTNSELIAIIVAFGLVRSSGSSIFWDELLKEMVIRLQGNKYCEEWVEILESLNKKRIFWKDVWEALVAYCENLMEYRISFRSISLIVIGLAKAGRLTDRVIALAEIKMAGNLHQLSNRHFVDVYIAFVKSKKGSIWFSDELNKQVFSRDYYSYNLVERFLSFTVTKSNIPLEIPEFLLAAFIKRIENEQPDDILLIQRTILKSWFPSVEYDRKELHRKFMRAVVDKMKEFKPDLKLPREHIDFLENRKL